MKKDPIHQISMQLLSIFIEVYRMRSVSQAADNLDLGQPMVSTGLAKLREHFNDPLFVRTPAGMEPTPHAETLIEPLQQALDLLRTTLSRQIVFDPLTSERTFRVGLLDISQIVMLPRLVNHIRSTAPNVRITSMHITQDIANMLESGAVDLAVGFIPQLQAGFYEQTLFGQDFVCIAARNHPFIDDQLTLEEFQQAKHIVVNIEGTGHGIVEKSLEKQQIQRNVALRLPSFLGISFIVQSTDLLATVPRLLAEKLVQHNDVKLLELPMELPIYKVKQHWHERYHRDPGVMWLRKVFANLFMQ